MTEPSGEPRRPPAAPRRRDYHDDPNRKQKPDSVERLRMFGPLFIGVGIGLTWGMVAGGAWFGQPFLGALVGMVVIGGLTWGITHLVVGGMGRGAAGVVLPSGKSTQYKRQYSDAEACTARGDHTAAILAYQRYVLEEPRDPEPYFRIARIANRELQDYEQAVEWYRRVRKESEIDAGRDLLATQELADLFIHKLRQPRKAIPELARLVDRYPQTPPGKAAVDELARLRAMMAEERDDEGESLTGRFYKDR